MAGGEGSAGGAAGYALEIFVTPGMQVALPKGMDLDQTFELLARKLTGWGRALILGLPNFLLAVATVVGFWLLARAARNVVMRVLRRVSQSEQVNYLLGQMVYVAILAAGTF